MGTGKTLSLFLIYTLSICCSNLLFSQPKNFKLGKGPVIIKKTTSIIQIDGLLEDSTWRDLDYHTGFYQSYPYDTGNANTQTWFALCHDDKFIYAGIICENRNNQKPFVINNLKRDFSVNTNDAVVLSLSPYMDGQNGFSFGVTPYNAQREGEIQNGGVYGVTTAWDQVWFSETHISEKYWFAELKIPFSSIRFVPGMKNWTFNVSRFDLRNNEVSNYTKVPRLFNVSSLVFADTMKWEKPIEKKFFNGVFVPYISNASIQPTKNSSIINRPSIGFDGKLGITPSLNLDVTVNPDFAQVDVDQQQINLSRYSLFFPERRQFFIENSDLFANFGFRQIRPFFSRRIGLSPSRENIPIEYGLRLSGKYGNDLRLGLMNVTTGTDASKGAIATNYTVAALQKKVLEASNVGLILVHDQRIEQNKNDYNSVIGTEFNFLTPDNTWWGKAFVQKSFYPGLTSEKGYAHASFLLYKILGWQFMWNHEYVSKYFQARTGFVPRVDNYDPTTGSIVKMDYWRLEPEFKRIYYPNSKLINSYSAYIYNSSYFDSAYDPTESLLAGGTEIKFQNSAYVHLTAYQVYYRLFLPFSPVKLNGGGYLNGEHQWEGFNVTFGTNSRKPFAFFGEVDFGGYFLDGNKQEYTANFTYRVPGLGRRKIPRLYLTGNIKHVDMNLRDSGSYSVDLLGLKADYSLSTTTYLIGYWQLNAQSKLMNINVRFQWRYRPMSDVFLVYSQNWDRTQLTPNANAEIWQYGGRSLALKLNYWF